MLSERSKQIRRDTLKLGTENGIYHYGGSFSMVEILIALYDKVMQPEDKLIISKGHGWIPQVVILREKGLNPGFGPRLDDPSQQCLVGHPFRDEANGIVANTGSLGHGMPLGVGIAFAKKFKREDGHMYVIVGDGECQEGTFWESLLLANKFQLDNLTVIIDYNRIQGSGRVEEILPIPITLFVNAAMHAGWSYQTLDGHHIPLVVSALRYRCHKPNLIIASTVKGKGVSFMENDPAWHAKFPSKEELEQAYKELQ